MKAKVEMTFDGANFGGGLELENISTVEAFAFMTTAMTKLLKDVHGVAMEQGRDKEKATALTLHCAELALDRYAEKIGKDTVQKAYEYNDAIKEMEGE